MHIPGSFKKAIAKLYDKTIYRCDVNPTEEADGWKSREAATITDEFFKANVQYTVSDALKEQYGIHETFDIAYTTGVENTVALAEVLNYDGRFFEVTRVLPFDSHLLVLCKSWLSKSSDSTSV